MPRTDYQPNILPSVLDRLLDDEPEEKWEPPANRLQDLDRFKNGVTRDLEALLNTRQEVLHELPDEFLEVKRSLVAYGLPDFSSLSLLSPANRNRIHRALERAIATFEPRLERVCVTLQPPREYDHTLRFCVEAWLRVEPAPEPVTFDAILHLNTQEYVVQGRN